MSVIAMVAASVSVVAALVSAYFARLALIRVEQLRRATDLSASPKWYDPETERLTRKANEFLSAIVLRCGK